MIKTARALALISRWEGVRIDTALLAEADKLERFANYQELSRFYKEHDLVVSKAKLGKDFAKDNRTIPCVVELKDGRALCVLGIDENTGKTSQLSILDPDHPGVLDHMEISELKDQSAGLIYRIENAKHVDQIKHFDKLAFWSIFAKRPLATSLLFILSMTMALLSLTPIIYLQIALDKVIGYGATSTFGVLTICTILAITAVYFLGRYRDDILEFFGAELEVQLNEPIMEKTLAAAKDQKVEPDMAIFSQGAIDKIRTILIGKLVKNTLDLTTVIILTPILFLYSPIIATLIVVYCGIATAVKTTGAMKAKYLRKDIDRSARKRSAAANETMLAGSSLDSYEIDVRHNRQWLKATQSYCADKSKLSSTDSVAAQNTTLIQSGLTVMIIFSGVELVLMGMLSPGSLIAINLLASRILSPLLKMGSLPAEIPSLKDAVEQVNKILSLPKKSSAPGLRPSISGHIKYEAVTLAHDHGCHIKDLSLSITAGSRVALLSQDDLSALTFAGALDGSINIESGGILLDDVDIRRIDNRWLNKRVIIVDADPHFFEGSVSDNLHGMHTDIDPQEIDVIASSAGLMNNTKALPEGLETLIKSDGQPLNYSTRIQLAVARAMASMPSVFIIKGAFDPLPLHHAEELYSVIHERIGGGTLIVSTVRADIADMLDKTYYITEQAISSEQMDNAAPKEVRAT